MSIITVAMLLKHLKAAATRAESINKDIYTVLTDFGGVDTERLKRLLGELSAETDEMERLVGRIRKNS